MAEKQKTLNYSDDELEVALVVARATTLMGMNRSILIFQAIDYINKKKADNEQVDNATETLRRFTYPDLVSSVVKVTGLEWPLSFEAFLTLPDSLTSEWEHTVYELNPHWLPGFDKGPEAEKKGKTSVKESGGT